MINALKKFFGFGPQTDYAALVKRGALIVDVRSKAEYQGGHIKGSININFYKFLLIPDPT